MTELQDRLNRGLAGRYVIDRQLGEGGMAVVFLAHDLRHDRPVALKLLRPELSSEIGPDRFLREINYEIRQQIVRGGDGNYLISPVEGWRPLPANS